jgi:hypothetical protein
MTLLLCTGSRYATIADHGLLVQRAVVDTIGPAAIADPHHLYVGDAGGVDFIVRQMFGTRLGWTVREFEADWEACGAGCPPRPHRRVRKSSGEPYCPYAGPRRNRDMVAAYADAGGRLALTLPERGGSLAHSGTWGCAREAADCDIEVRVRSLAVSRRG